MIIVVSGWRHWITPSFVHAHLEAQVDMYGGRSIHWRVGDCPTGVDRITRSYISLEIGPYASFTVYYANWARFRHVAGPIRNEHMLKGEDNPDDLNPGVLADKLLAFPQPGIDWKQEKAGGTVGCILKAVDLGISLEVPGCKAPM